MSAYNNFTEKLAAASRRNHSLLCVGLDTDPDRLPTATDVYEFNRDIIEATADLVCAYKPNIAFYEALGTDGLDALKKTRDCVPPDIPVIIDAKRGDIGNTARAYARALFDHLGFDAVTASPYLGFDSLEPFIERRDRAVFVLCRTSNAGATDFQSLPCRTESGERTLFEVVAEKVDQWNQFGNLGLVVGATYPEELKLIRQRYPDMLLLIPGVGAQGGDLSLTVSYGADAGRQRTIVNSSRQIIYASKGPDFAAAARAAALEMRDRMNECLDRPVP
jgi:orotidine-5'-phosphate decarboxylase